MKTMIDLSHWQDNKTGPLPQLGQAADNAVDAFLFKAGRGNGTVSKYDLDPSYAEFVGQVKQLDMPWGAYWWPEPMESNPQEQAELFLSRAHAPGEPWFLDVDIEGHRGGTAMTPLEQATWQRTFIDELRHQCDLPVLIYTADWYWDGNIFPSGIDFSDCDLRVAHYYKGTPPARATGWTAWLAGRQPDPVKGFPTWDAWQFSAAGNGLGPILGMESADVDLNIIKDETWSRWCGDERDARRFNTLELAIHDIRNRLDKPMTGTINLTR